MTELEYRIAGAERASEGGMAEPMPIRAVVFEGPGRPSKIEQLLLDPPGPGEVLVRMAASGVCHSDLHVVDGEWERPSGVVLGHEGASIVEDVGPGVEHVRPGDLVVLSWTAPCGRCTACVRGEQWLCSDPAGADHRLRERDVRLRRPDGTPIGAYSGIGTFGTHQVVAASAAVPIDPRTPPEVAALIGCAVTTGVGAVRTTAAVRPGESVAVIGVGGVGLAAVMAARERGADPVIAIDTSQEKLDLAEQAGADSAIHPHDAPTVVAVDHAVECIGLVETVELAVDLVRPGGIVTLVGMTPQGHRASFDVYRFVEDGKQIRGSNYGSAVPSRDFPRIASDYLAGRLPLDLLITEQIGLDGLDGAFEAMRRGSGVRRVVRF